MPAKETRMADALLQDAVAVKRIQARMPADAIITDTAELFKVLGDRTRAKILFALKKEELCVGDIASLLGMSQSAISHQLRSLKEHRFLRVRRAGKLVYYSLHDHHISQLLDAGLEHVAELCD